MNFFRNNTLGFKHAVANSLREEEQVLRDITRIMCNANFFRKEFKRTSENDGLQKRISKM